MLKKEKISKAIKLLKFIITLNDQDVIKTTIESIIDLLEDK